MHSILRYASRCASSCDSCVLLAFARAQSPAQELAQLHDHVLRLARLGLVQARDTVQSVEQEVRIELRTQCAQALLRRGRLDPAQQQPLVHEPTIGEQARDQRDTGQVEHAVFQRVREPWNQETTLGGAEAREPLPRRIALRVQERAERIGWPRERAEEHGRHECDRDSPAQTEAAPGSQDQIAAERHQRPQQQGLDRVGDDGRHDLGEADAFERVEHHAAQCEQAPDRCHEQPDLAWRRLHGRGQPRPPARARRAGAAARSPPRSPRCAKSPQHRASWPLTHAAPSSASRWRFASSPPPKPVSDPFEPITR